MAKEDRRNARGEIRQHSVCGNDARREAKRETKNGKTTGLQMYQTV